MTCTEHLRKKHYTTSQDPTAKPNTSIVILNNKLPDTVSSQILPEKVGSNAVSMASSKHLIQGKDKSFNNINNHDHDHDD